MFNNMQPDGVTVAQVILVHFVLVRIQVRLPFLCLYERHNSLIINKVI